VKKTCAQRETLVIAGCALDEGKWDGLYLARRKGRQLIYAAKVDHGFDPTVAKDLQARLRPLIRKTQPYTKRMRAMAGNRPWSNFPVCPVPDRRRGERASTYITAGEVRSLSGTEAAPADQTSKLGPVLVCAAWNRPARRSNTSVMSQVASAIQDRSRKQSTQGHTCKITKAAGRAVSSPKCATNGGLSWKPSQPARLEFAMIALLSPERED
jgi:hypothetical protein